MFCSKCGNQLVAGSSFCGACGAPTMVAPAPAPTNVVQPPVAPAPGINNAYNTVFVPAGKSRTTAIVLAIFLGNWAWLYTYRADKSKFWISMGIGLALFFSNVVAPGISLLGIAFNIWAIVDAVSKKPEWYAAYFKNFPA